MKRTLLVMLSTIFVTSRLFAVGSGALGNQTGVSAKATAHGFAFAGIADDPSAIFYNPAGLVQVKGWQMMAGLTVLDINATHSTPSGTNDDMASNLPVAPNFYLSYSNNSSKWAFGFGVNSPFGLITEWKDDSFSKYYATESKLLMYDVNPTVAYSITDKMAVGAGVNFFNVYDVELNQRVPGVSDGHGKFSGNGTGWGYNLGLHWKPVQQHSFGLSYRSQVNVVVEGNTELKDVSAPLSAFIGGSSYNTGANTEVKFPQSVLLGYGFRPTSKWTIFTDYEWVNWSSTNETKFNYEQNNVLLPQSIARDWKSTSNFGVGAEWKATEHVDLRFGGLVYERVVPSGTLESSIPDASRGVVTLGSGFHFGNTSLDFAYNGIFFDKRTVDNGAGNAFSSMDGTFKTFINVLSVGISQKWGGV